MSSVSTIRIPSQISIMLVPKFEIIGGEKKRQLMSAMLLFTLRDAAQHSHTLSPQETLDRLTLHFQSSICILSYSVY